MPTFRTAGLVFGHLIMVASLEGKLLTCILIYIKIYMLIVENKCQIIL